MTVVINANTAIILGGYRITNETNSKVDLAKQILIMQL